MSEQIHNKVTILEMILSLSAMYGIIYIDWIPIEKKAIMVSVYAFLVFIQIFIYILNLNKPAKKMMMFMAMLCPIIISIIWTYFKLKSGDTFGVKEGISSIFIVISTPHPYELGWWVVKGFFTSLLNKQNS